MVSMNPGVEDQPVRVMLVDDHDGFRSALRSVLEGRPWVELTQEASSGEQALLLLEAERPDVVVMDFSLPGINGLKTTEEVVRVSTARVIGLSMHDKGPYSAAMRDAGASAWLVKGGSIDELLQTIRIVASGETTW